MKKIFGLLFLLVVLMATVACTETTTQDTASTNTTTEETTLTTQETTTTEEQTTTHVDLTSLQIIGTVEDYYFIDDEIQLGVMYNPINASDKGVTWSSSATDVATVTSTGLVTCVGVGSADITVTSDNNAQVSATVTINVEEDVLYGLTETMLNSIPAETDLQRWDVAWGSHPGEYVADLFDLSNTATVEDVIWRQVNPSDSQSVLADAGYGAILNALETEDNDTAGLAIYNKVSFSDDAESLEIIARGTPNGANGGDPSLSGRGMFRVSLLIPTENGYELHILTQSTDNYPQDENGWITYEEPPVVDQKDAFMFDISAFAGIENVIVVIEANDRMDTVGDGGTNLADRVMILAVRIIEPDYIFGSLLAENLDAIASETNLLKWDFAWGGQGTSASLIDFAGTAIDTDMIWRCASYVDSSVIVDAGYGAVMNAFESVDDTDPALAMYNKTSIPANAETLTVVARGQQVADSLSGAGQFRVVVYYKNNDVYESVVLTASLTASQIAAGITQDANGYVTFDVPPTIDVDDAFTFDISALAGISDAIFVIEANDRMDTTSTAGENLADRVLILAIRINVAPSYVFSEYTADALNALVAETNLLRWDFAWGGQGATTSLIDFAGTAISTDIIWRSFAYEASSVIADAGYGAILNAYESDDDTEAAIAMFNKTDISSAATNLVVVARGQQVADSLSGAGQFRVVVYVNNNGVYEATVLTAQLTASQVSAGITQDANGYVTFDVPPTVDVDDLFTFDLSAFAGVTGAIIVVEANDRMDTTSSTGTNLADRILVLAVRIIETV